MPASYLQLHEESEVEISTRNSLITMTHDSHFEVHMIKNMSNYIISLSEYINATCLHLTGSL